MKGNPITSICYVIDALAIHGGLERITIDKMNALSSNPSYKIFLITSSQAHKDFIYPLSDRVEHHDLNLSSHHQYLYRYPRRFLEKIKYHFQFKERLKKVIIQIKPDIIIGSPNTNVWAILAMKGLSRIIIETHCARTYIEQDDGGKRNGLSNLLNRCIKKRMTKAIVEKADAIVTLTEADAQEWKKAKNVFVIPNFIHQSQSQDYNLHSTWAVASGRLVYQKGFDILIKAWAIVDKKHADWKLMIYGDGEEYKTLQNEIKKNNLTGKVLIHHAISDFKERLSEYAFFVLSSRFEGFGMVLVEAMMTGVPCVSTNCQYGPAEIIKNGEDGLIVATNDAKELASKINWMIEHPDERLKMSIKGTENSQRYKEEKIMPKWHELFTKIKS